MRLTPTEKNSLLYALEDVKGEVYLFGSRTNDLRKGGDIDILVFSDEESYETSKKIAVRFFSKCESKIDVIVVNPITINNEQRAFIAAQNLIKIK